MCYKQGLAKEGFDMRVVKATCDGEQSSDQIICAQTAGVTGQHN